MHVRKKKKNDKTWIYLMHDPRSGYYKVGQSVRPWQRLKTLLLQGTLLPFAHEFVLVEAWFVHPDEEREIHRRLEHCHVRGEWFAADTDDLAMVRCYFYDAVCLTTGKSARQEADESDAARGLVRHLCVRNRMVQLL